MDVQTIDAAYDQLQNEAKDTSAKLQALAGKLQTAAQGGDQNAREWLLDLREIALAVRDEEGRVASLLQAMHGFAVTTLQASAAQPPAYPPPQPNYPPQPPPGYPPPGYGGFQQPGFGGGNPLQGFLNSGFGRAIEMGLGFGLGDDLINRIF